MTRHFDDSDIYGIQILWTSERGIDTGSKETDEETDSCISAALDRAGFAPMSSAGNHVETIDCEDEELKKAVFAGMDDWWNSRFSDISEIESVEDGGRVLRARIDEATYELDDEDDDSLISRLRIATGHTYEWRDDYEPQSNGTTTVTLEQA